MEFTGRGEERGTIKVEDLNIIQEIYSVGIKHNRLKVLQSGLVSRLVTLYLRKSHIRLQFILNIYLRFVN